MADPTRDRLQGLKVAVTGASGTVGTALLRRLTAPGSGVAEVRGLARRQPPSIAPYDGVQWHLADLGETRSDHELTRFLDGADAVVHLTWALQPGRQPERLHRVNVDGTRRLARAAAAGRGAHLVHLASLRAQAPGGGDREGTADLPTTRNPTSQHSRDKTQAALIVREQLGA